MSPTRISNSKIKAVRDAILRAQGYRCAICNASLHATAKKDPVLDHDHDTGFIRGVLCRNCNQMEGKVKTCATRARGSKDRIGWLSGLLTYWTHHAAPQTNLLHPTHKTEEEKRLARNKAARERRAVLKAMQ